MDDAAIGRHLPYLVAVPTGIGAEVEFVREGGEAPGLRPIRAGLNIRYLRDTAISLNLPQFTTANAIIILKVEFAIEFGEFKR